MFFICNIFLLNVLFRYVIYCRYVIYNFGVIDNLDNMFSGWKFIVSFLKCFFDSGLINWVMNLFYYFFYFINEKWKVLVLRCKREGYIMKMCSCL